MRKLKIYLAIAMSLIVFATPILAQQGEIMKGRMDGEQAARSNVNGTLWLAVGCVGCVVGLAMAYIYEPNPSATLLLGKSPEYVAAYTDGYKSAAKSVQTNRAWIGCVVNGLAWIAYFVLVTAAADTTY